MSRKKLLFLSSFGGYGHIAAANTLTHLLGKDYEIETVYPIKELRVCGLPSGEAFYNFLIARSWNRATNLVARTFIPAVFSTHEKKLIELIDRHIEEKKPDMLISLIPCVNYGASEAARGRSLPLLLATTDNDLHNWVFSLEKRKHTQFRVTIGANLPTTRGALLKKGVPAGAIETIGLPLRPEFLNVKSKEFLRSAYNIPPKKPVVLIMMGGMGASAIFRYTKELLKKDLGIHLVVCAGKNRILAAKLKQLEEFGGNTMDVIPFTEKVHELFALSDLLITKPGPGTINEAFSLNLPLLIDCTLPPLFWEAANIDYVKNLKVGECVHSFKEAPLLVEKFLFDAATKEAVKSAYAKVPKNRFAERIPHLIEEMIGAGRESGMAMNSQTQF